MRHKNPLRKLGRDAKHRKALFRNLATSLIQHDRITTTFAKAKEMQKLMDRLVHKAKRGETQDHSFIHANLFENSAMKRLNKEVAPRFTDVSGGFTRVEYLGRRKNDKAEMAMIEFTKNPIRDYEENEQALEVDDFGLQTFWAWEQSLLEQEQAYFEDKLRTLKDQIDHEKSKLED